MSCASEIQAAVYTSPVQIIYAIIQILIFIVTIIGSILAIVGLARKSTIPDSTRILLVGSLFFANAHELAYVHSPVSASALYRTPLSVLQLYVLKLNLFHSNTTCYPLMATIDCVPTTTVLAMGISGNMLIQSALSIDRFGTDV